ncbi:MAG: hypothetical protein ABSC51_09425 [Gaiellaceae bacterium]|jgi:hypothetical protein
MNARRKLRRRRQRRWRHSAGRRLIGLGLLSIAIGAATAAFTASNTVATSWAVNKAHTISVPELTPANCVGAAVGNVTFYRIVAPGGGTIRAESGHTADTNQIWLGTSGRDNMNGGSGNDCMVPGGNSSALAETVAGGAGTDYCYSGPGPGPYTINANCENATRPTGPYTTVVTASPVFS